MKDLKRIMLISPNFIKEATNISDNVNEKLMYASIREAQDIELRNIIGGHMLNKLKMLVDDETITLEENCAYADLLDECQYFLAYTVLVKLCIETQFKIDNAGIFTTSDEHIENLSVNDTFTVMNYWKQKRDYYALLLQKYILGHRGELPEINECCCNQIRANLYSAASCGLVLGGPRGKIIK